MSDDGRISVVIADDHALVRDGTREILGRHPDLRVVGEVASGEEVPAVVAETAPDVVLLDVRLPGISGIDVLRTMRAEQPEVKVIMLTAFAEREYVSAALAAGAAGYLLKTAPGDELVAAIRAVMSGATVLDRAVSLDLAQGATGRGGGAADLTRRETELVGLVVEGLPNKAIAARLGISPRTVDGHLARLFSKLGVATRTELARYATTHGLVDGHPT